VAEASIRAETESSAPPVSEPPTIGTDGHGTTGQDSIKKEPRDLWREAVEKLDEKQRTTLGLLDMAESPPPSAVNAIEDVVQKTEKNLEAYNTSGQMKRRDGKVLINVRENAKKILRGTLRVKDIIDAGVKFDPSGYGRLSSLEGPTPPPSLLDCLMVPC
jgi:FtsZ-interacting cell division protein ZipA